MNTFEIIVVALALVFNSWILYLNAGIALAGASLIRKLNYAGIMFGMQFLLSGVGIWIGYRTGSLEPKINLMISISIFFIFGLKVLLSGIKTHMEDKAFDYAESKVNFLTGLAEGITALVLGIAVGLLSEQPFLHWMLTAVFLLFGMLFALLFAPVINNSSMKLRLAPIGGLLLLAIAIKLTINLTGF